MAEEWWFELNMTWRMAIHKFQAWGVNFLCHGGSFPFSAVHSHIPPFFVKCPCFAIIFNSSTPPSHTSYPPLTLTSILTCWSILLLTSPLILSPLRRPFQGTFLLPESPFNHICHVAFFALNLCWKHFWVQHPNLPHHCKPFLAPLFPPFQTLYLPHSCHCLSNQLNQ